MLRTGNFLRIHSRFPVRSNRKPRVQVKFLPVHSITMQGTNMVDDKNIEQAPSPTRPEKKFSGAFYF